MAAKEKIKNSEAFGKKDKSEKKQEFAGNEIVKPEGANTKRMRIGRGPGSGNGKTSGRGSKGQKARNTVRRGFEGGQMPIHRRLPKRGFTNIFHKEYQAVNLRDIEKAKLSGTVDPAALAKSGIIKEETGLVKILGTGEISKAVNLVADKFSKSAEEKITKAGGTISVRPPVVLPKKADKINRKKI